MKTLSATSRANFAMSLGEETKDFVEKCDRFSMRLSDAAESEKSAPLRRCLHATSEKIDQLVNELQGMLGATAS